MTKEEIASKRIYYLLVENPEKRSFYSLLVSRTELDRFWNWFKEQKRIREVVKRPETPEETGLKKW